MTRIAHHPLFTWLQCSACQQWLPATSEFFAARALSVTSHRWRCLECTGRGRLMAPESGLAQNPDVEHVCTRCGQLWPLSREFFRPLPRHLGRLHDVCRACESEARLRRAGVCPPELRVHTTDAIAPLLTGAHFFKGEPA